MDDAFCPACRRSSSNEGPGSLATNQGIGKSFYGRRDVCDDCGSAVRTLWTVFLFIPLIPWGSYRVIEFEEEAANRTSVTPFVARKVAFQWPQVLKTCGVAFGALLFLLWLVANGARR
jgi:hypothetical protein